jgi:hypothetical protein
MPNALMSYLPPVVIGAGALIPLIFKDLEIWIPLKLRTIASIVGVLGSFVAYYLAWAFGEIWMFSAWMTVLPLLSAFLLLGMVLFWGIRSAKSFPKSKLPQLVGSYVAAILLISLAVANLERQEGMVIVEFTAEQGLQKISAIDTNENQRDLGLPHSGLTTWKWVEEEQALKNLAGFVINENRIVKRDAISESKSPFSPTHWTIRLIEP